MEYVVDLIVFLASGSLFTTMMVRNEFLYQRVSESHNFTANHSFHYCAPNETATSGDEEIVANEVSRWSIYIDLAEGLPAIIFSVLLTSWSDKVGRKLPLGVTVFGCTLMAISQLLVIYFKWPYCVLVINGLLYGVTGSFPSLLNISMAHLSDITEEKEKIKRFTILECAMGIGGGMTSFATGFWISADGFIPTSCFAAAICFVSLLLVPFIPSGGGQSAGKSSCSAETINSNNEKKHPLIYGNNQNEEVICTEPSSTFVSRLKVVKRIYTSEQSFCGICEKGRAGRTCEHGGGLRRGRVWRIWLYILSFNLILYTLFGTAAFATMYFSAYPLCFSPVLIGANTMLKYGLLVFSPLIVKLCKNVLKWSAQSIISISVMCTVFTMVIIGFATDAYLVFIAASLYAVNHVSSPAIRSQISSLVSATEQGAALSLISAAESFSNMVGTLSYLVIYPATVSLYFGFAWLYSAAVLCIPLTLMLIMWIIDRRQSDELEEEREALISH